MTVFMVDIAANFHKRACFREQISCNMERDIDAKERADRMAAAEAMSALSSVVVTHTGDSPPPRAKRSASRGRGRGRGRGRRSNTHSGEVNSDSTKSRSRTRTNLDIANSNVTERSRNRPGRVTTSKSKLVNNESPEPKRSPRRRSKNSLSESESPKTSRARTKIPNSDYGEMPVLEPQVSNTPSLPSLPSNLTLTLPSLNIPSLGTLPTLGSLPSLFNTDVNNDKQPKKQDNKTLPFKKRRLINSERDGEDSDEQDCRPERNLATDSLPSTPSLSSKLQIDPGQQIRLFGEIQAALTADEDGDIPLHLAVVHEHLPLVQKFIQLMRIARRSVDRFNKDKQTPMHLAVKLNFLPGVKALLEAGADVNFVDKTGCSSLHLAVKHQLPQCLKLLVQGSKVEADFNTRNFEGLTPLHTAVEMRNMQLLAFILDLHADINMTDGKSGRTALFHAAENNQEEIVDYLLKRGANPDILNYAGSTAVMAAQARNYNIVTKMLSRVSDWVEEDRSGSSSPVSEISVYVPDHHGPKPQRPPVRIPGHPGPSSHDPVTRVKATETTQSRSPARLFEASSETVTTNIDDKRKTSSSSSCQTPIHDLGRGKKLTNELKKPVEENKLPEKKSQPGLINSEFNTIANLKAISELAKRSPQVALELQKLYEAKQRQLQASRASSEVSASASASASTSTLVSTSSSPRAASICKPGSSLSSRSVNEPPKQGNVTPKLGHQSPKLAKTPPKPGDGSPKSVNYSPKPVHFSPKGKSSPRVSSSRMEATELKDVEANPSPDPVAVTMTEPSHSEANSAPRTVAAPSQVIGKVSHVVDKQQPERIISTGMVVEHPEYGLVFRPFGPGGQMQPLNQSVSRPGTPGRGESGSREDSTVTDEIKINKDVLSSGKDSPVLSGKLAPDTELANSSHASSSNLNISRQGTPSNSRQGTPSNSRQGTPSNSRHGTPSNSRQGTPSNSRPATPSNSHPGTPNSRPATPGKQSSCLATPSNVEVQSSQELSPSKANLVKDGDSLKDKEKISVPSMNKDILRLTQKARIVSESLQESRSKSPVIPFSPVSSYPVTEKLLNAKPKSQAIPSSRVPEKTVKLQEVPKDLNVKTIANSAIAAKLRQRVLNSPHVDTATKAQTVSPIPQPVTIQPRGVVTTAPERVPKLPQFGSKQGNSKSDEQSSSSDSSSISEQPSAVDLTKSKSEKMKKTEKRKKKESGEEGKKKSTKGDNSKESTSPQPMDTS